MVPARLAILVGAGLLLYSSNLAGQGPIQVLHTFTDFEGAQPVSLMQATDNSFYGTTQGTQGVFPPVPGTIFKATLDGSVSVLHTFPDLHGPSPSGLTQGTDGLYGMTPGFHLFFPGTNATIFKITADGTFSIVHEFDETVDTFASDLIQASDGNFYGMLNSGLAHGPAAALRLTPAGVITILHTFNGVGSASSLIQARDGRFYGTTSGAGSFDAGTVFTMTADGDSTVLYTFPATLGHPVAALVEGRDGNLYGTTGGNLDGTTSVASDYGSVFRISPTGDLTSLHAFTGRADGAYPVRPLIQGSNGNFYGTTSGTGGLGGPATVFEVTPTGLKTVLYSFGTERPGLGSLLQATDGNLYGVASSSQTLFRLLLSVLAPSIVMQPSDQVTVAGQRAQLRVIVTANPPPTYRWQHSADHGSSWTDVPSVAPYTGTTTDVLTIASADLAITGTQYRVVVTHPIKTLTSDAATLTVLDPNLVPSPAPGAVFTLTSASDQRWLTLPVVAGRSYCGQIAPARTATDAATPTLTVYRAAGNTVLATRTGVSGSACFVSPATETALLRVTQADASARTYRVRTVETTAWANWFFIGGSYTSYTLLRNTAETTLHATVTWRADTGAIVGSETASIAPGGVWSRDARRATTAGTTLGSVDVAHDGEPQALVGSQTTLSPVTGLAVDTVLRQRMAW